MAIWKDKNGGLWDDMDGAALSLPSWPQGMTLYTGVYPPPAPAPTQAQIIASFEAAVQNWLDTTAQSWQYESILSAASYAASTVQKFKDEAAALIAWRDAVWNACYTAEAAIQAGTQAMPASTAAFIATLPQVPARPA
ncbi:MAG: hypothetical protein KGL39_52455 [Patescibacteria group bacterium]|nr:hypothetical protein [Patescibacteria group bacterium]